MIKPYEVREVLESTQKKLAEVMAERDALAAQVEALRSRISAAERVETIFSEATELNFEECKKMFPEEIRELRAEAGRAGFVEGYDSCWFEHYGTRAKDHSYCFAANQYAESILKGELK